MSDGKASHVGMQRDSMKELVEALKNDAVVQELHAEITNKLDHPTKRIETNLAKLRVSVEPAGFSQTRSSGKLDLQYFFWMVIKYRPAEMEVQRDDDLTYLCEHLCDTLHRKTWGPLATFFSKTLVNFKSCSLQWNHRSVEMKLEQGEFGAIMCFWQTPKNLNDVKEDEYEKPQAVVLMSEDDQPVEEEE